MFIACYLYSLYSLISVWQRKDALIIACTVVQLSCFISHWPYYRKWQFSNPHILKTVQPILTKFETYNYLSKTTRHARPHIAASTWVVWANTQFATVSFFPCLFSFFIPSAHAQVAAGDRSAPKLARKCCFGQGCAFWASR